MTTLVTKGVFDVLHSNHKIFLSTLIEKSNADSILILLSSDKRASFFKGVDRPLFNYQWRQHDLLKFLIQKLPASNIRFKEIKVATQDTESLGEYINNSKFLIGLKSQYDWFYKEYPGISNLITLREQLGHHTTDIYHYLKNGENTSGCNTAQRAAVRVRKGKIESVGINGVFRSEATKIGMPASCRKCKPGRCSYFSETEVALADAVPGDDLFLSYTPNLAASKLIVQKNINRVVYFQETENREGLEYLKSNNIKIKKAGV